MPNTAYLLATDTPGPTVDGFGDPRYKTKEIIARAPITFPICWLACFEPRHLVEVTVEGEIRDVPSLVAEAAAARMLFAERSDFLLDAFPEFGSTLASFERLLDRSKRRFLKVHVHELWMLDPNNFRLRLAASLLWFNSEATIDFEQILLMASIGVMIGVGGYDSVRRTFPAEEGSPRAFHLRGYAWNEKDWNNEADR